MPVSLDYTGDRAGVVVDAAQVDPPMTTIRGVATRAREGRRRARRDPDPARTRAVRRDDPADADQRAGRCDRGVQVSPNLVRVRGDSSPRRRTAKRSRWAVFRNRRRARRRQRRPHAGAGVRARPRRRRGDRARSADRIGRSSSAATRGCRARCSRARSSPASRRPAATSCRSASCRRPRSPRSRPRIEAAAGVMISASHNPIEDNGIKLFGADGFKLSDAVGERRSSRCIETDASCRGRRGSTSASCTHDARSGRQVFREAGRGGRGSERMDGRRRRRVRRGISRRAEDLRAARRARRRAQLPRTTAAASTSTAARRTWTRCASACARRSRARRAPSSASRSTATPIARCSSTRPATVLDGDHVMLASPAISRRAASCPATPSSGR